MYSYIAIQNGRLLFAGKRLYELVHWAIGWNLIDIKLYRCRGDECADIGDRVEKEIEQRINKVTKRTCKTPQS